jgi:metal-responsive CopG/Arc/MetJ family transcriptional regulator
VTHTLTIRLTEELEQWLDKVSRETGIPRSAIVRDHLERERAGADWLSQRLDVHHQREQHHEVHRLHVERLAERGATRHRAG